MSARSHHTVVAGQRHLVRVFPVSGLSVCWLQADGGARYAVGASSLPPCTICSNMFRKPVTDSVRRPYVRHFGFLANRSKGLLAKCRQLLNLSPTVPKLPQRSVQELMLQLTGVDITRCPLCQNGTLVFLANCLSLHHGILRDD
jgi:hypothetical protein